MPAGVVLVFLMNLVLGRLLGPEEYGTFNFLYVAANMIAVVVSFGIPMASMRFTAEYEAKHEWDNLKGVLVWAVKTLSLAALATSVLIVVAAATRPDHLPAGLRTMILAGLVPLTVVWLWRRYTALGFRVIWNALLPREVIVPVMTIAGCLWLGTTTAGDAIIVYLAAVLLSEALGLTWLWHTIPAQVKTAVATRKSRYWLSVSCPLALTSMAQLGLNRWDVLLLGGLVGMEATGRYSAAIILSLAGGLMLRVVNTVVAPMISDTYHRMAYGELRTILIRGTLWSGVGGGVVFIVLVVWAEQVLALFGPGYSDAAHVLRILAVGPLVSALTGPVGNALAMTGHQGVQAKIMLWATVGSLIANTVFITLWQEVGAAIATSGSMIVLNIVFFVVAHKRIRSAMNGAGHTPPDSR